MLEKHHIERYHDCKQNSCTGWGVFMASKTMHKAVAYLGAILCFVAVIPIDVLSWWKADITQIITSDHFSNYINAFGQWYHKVASGNDYTITNLGNLFLFAGIIVIIGGVILIAGGAKNSKGIAVIGAIIAIIGPIMFLVALNGLDSVADLLLSSGAMKFFGSGNVYFHLVLDIQYGTGTWYLNIGFFLAIIGAILGFASIKSSKK